MGASIREIAAVGLAVLPLLACGAGVARIVAKPSVTERGDGQAAVAEAATELAAAFVGSEACAECHSDGAGRGSDQYDRWLDSGHPYKLTRIEGAAPIGAFPAFSRYAADRVEPPAGLGWEDVSYVVGGYGWKMRWVDQDGYVVTSGASADLVQYNFESREWTTYHPQDELGSKAYGCGACHTTGWVADEDAADDGDLSDNQDRRPGMGGTFSSGGINCEQCHGMGGRHVRDPERYSMEIDRSSAACGVCHRRDPEHHIAAKGGFIRHREQYDEWLHSPHNTPTSGCNDCHDPHASVKYDGVAKGDGVKVECEACHDEITHVKHDGAVRCIDCHMPEAVKSAVKISEYQADIRTHIWAINTESLAKAAGMFDPTGNFVAEDANGLGRISLDFACYGCHADQNGEGGPDSRQTLAGLSAYAAGMHERPSVDER